MGKKGKINLFVQLNNGVKKYQYLINLITIVIGFAGVIITVIQLNSSTETLKQNIYTFNGEQYPILSFRIFGKDSDFVKIDEVIPKDMLFQRAYVYWHPTVNNQIDNPDIKINDKNWYLAPLTEYLKNVYKFEPLFNKYKNRDYLTCEVPAALKINYVKYGESRHITAIYDIELIVNKNTD